MWSVLEFPEDEHYDFHEKNEKILIWGPLWQVLTITLYCLKTLGNITNNLWRTEGIHRRTLCKDFECDILFKAALIYSILINVDIFCFVKTDRHLKNARRFKILSSVLSIIINDMYVCYRQ